MDIIRIIAIGNAGKEIAAAISGCFFKPVQLIHWGKDAVPDLHSHAIYTFICADMRDSTIHEQIINAAEYVYSHSYCIVGLVYGYSQGYISKALASNPSSITEYARAINLLKEKVYTVCCVPMDICAAQNLDSIQEAVNIANMICDITYRNPYIGLDLLDIVSTLKTNDYSCCGIGTAPTSAPVEAVKKAFAYPTIEYDPHLANGALLYILSPNDMSLDAISDILSYASENISDNACAMFGLNFSDGTTDEFKVSVMLTGWDHNNHD